MKKIAYFIQKYEKTFFFVLLVVFCILFLSTYLFTTIPLTQGWGEFYVDIISSGKVPYKDFYYYIPPLNLIIDTIFWKLSFGHLIIYQIYRVIERLTMIGLLYSLLCKVTKPRYACLASCVGATMLSGVIWDIVGDYNQTCLLLTIILTTLYYKYAENFNSSQKKQYGLLFLAGLTIGISFLLKQPLFGVECLIFFPLITICFIIKHKKHYLKSLLISLLGIIIPISIASIVMVLNGSFIPFINQVYFGASGKGSIYNILMVVFTACFKYKYILISALFILYFYLKNKELNEKNSKEIKYLALTIFLVLASTIFLVYGSQIVSLESLLNLKIGIVGVGILLFTIIIDLILRKFKKNNSILSYTLYIGIITFMMSIVCFKELSAAYIYNQTQSYSLLNEICVFATIGCISMLIYCIVKYKKTNEIYYLKWGLIFAGSFVYEYVTAMGSTDSLQTGGCIMEVAALIAFILHNFGIKSLSVKTMILCFSIFIVVTVTSQKITNAYSWWGWTESITNETKKYSIDVPGMEGYRVSYDVKSMYEEMYKVLKYNTDKDSVIYGFPHVKIFNVLLNNTNMDTFVPVPFYDVCSDIYAIRDAKKLEHNQPDIVIWVDLPGAMEIHEKIFRNGKPLGQRRIQEWFSRSLNNDEYKLIGQYNSIFIYKLNDGENINYTFYKDENAVNQTIINNED